MSVFCEISGAYQSNYRMSVLDVYKRQGKEIAEMIYERHKLLSSWLTALGVNKDTAAEDACRIEHVISKESFEAIKKHVK